MDDKVGSIEPVNVLFIHKWFSLSGGVERVHKNLSFALEEFGVTSSFYVFDVTGNKSAGYKALVGERDAFHPPQKVSKLKKIWALVAHVKNVKPTAIIAATETANILALICSVFFPSVKIIYTRHCAFDVSDQKLSPAKIKLLYNLYSLSGGSIIGVSSSLREQIFKAVKFGKKDIRFIPNAVISEAVDKLAETNTDDFKRLPYFVAVGRLVEQKGFDLLIEAFALAKQSNFSLPNLLIVGFGEDEAKLKDLALRFDVANYVEFYGFTKNPYFIIKHAEAFVLSSRHEGMPTVLIESMYLNTPVISFDCPTGPSELIKNEKNGLLVENGNIALLSDALLNYRTLKGKITSEYADVFKFNHVARSYLNVIRGE